MDFDIGSEELHRLLVAIGAKVAELTGMPPERAEKLAGSVVGHMWIIDDDGMLLFRDEGEQPAVSLPHSAFAALLEGSDVAVPLAERWKTDDGSELEFLEDVGPEELHRCTKAVGERLRKLTGIPRRRAESLAVEVCGCVRIVDDEGLLVFRDGLGRVAFRRPYSEFANILRWDEEEERLAGLEANAAGEIP